MISYEKNFSWKTIAMYFGSVQLASVKTVHGYNVNKQNMDEKVY